ncbi:MAG TPA: polysaccharide biosynthesis C-terminal domain-containing protein, partial [Chitinophagales bacterium]|nr:polysaccharide biosynthesis C-terminal domain-containing protein [Chitinophagales bacterium]
AVNASANFLLIPKWGLPGAAAAAALTYAVITVYTAVLFAKESPIMWKDIIVGRKDFVTIAEALGWGKGANYD